MSKPKNLKEDAKTYRAKLKEMRESIGLTKKGKKKPAKAIAEESQLGQPSPSFKKAEKSNATKKRDKMLSAGKKKKKRLVKVKRTEVVRGVRRVISMLQGVRQTAKHNETIEYVIDNFSGLDMHLFEVEDCLFSFLSEKERMKVSSPTLDAVKVSESDFRHDLHMLFKSLGIVIRLSASAFENTKWSGDEYEQAEKKRYLALGGGLQSLLAELLKAYPISEADQVAAEKSYALEKDEVAVAADV